MPTPLPERERARPAKKKNIRSAAKSRAVKKRRKRIMKRSVRLFLLMFGVFVFVFALSALATGNIGRVAQIARGVFTPGMPRLIIRDAQHEYKVTPMNRNQTREIQAFLSLNYEDNQGIVTLNSESNTVAGLQNQPPIQRQLTKIGYSPQTLTVKQFLSQEIAFATPPTGMEAYIFFQEEVNSSPTLDEINSFLPDSDGVCYVLIDAFWETAKRWQRNRSGMYCFAVMFDRPAAFTLSAEDIDPGELLVFYAEFLTPGETVSVQSGLPLNLRFSPYGGRQMIALAPISYDIPPGTYATTLSAGGASRSFSITVKDKEFAVQYVNIDPQVAAETRNEATDKEFRDKINPILAEQSPELLWRGKAMLPVPESRVLTLFGSRRYVNDDVNSYRHSGLDLEAPIGTEVKAVNNGKVLFADYLGYTGNTVLIEHGLGLKSWYYHMEEILVAPGEPVSTGDVIGFTGQTGFAAEPHLHLTLSVGDVCINPVTAINEPLFSSPLP